MEQCIDLGSLALWTKFADFSEYIILWIGYVHVSVEFCAQR